VESSNSASGIVAGTALALLVLLIVVMASNGAMQPPDAGGIHIGISR
jgi:hypothetical protein